MRRGAALGAVLLGALLFYGAAHAAPAMQTQRVIAIKPNGVLVLAEGGNAVLAGIILPDAARAQTWLYEHALQRDISFTAAGEDRYGRLRIHALLASEMLRAGVAVFYADDSPVPAEWRAAEAVARTAKRGFWAGENAALMPENAAQHVGGFHVVEGRITRIYEGKSATYLNFGDDWHHDFSIRIDASTRRGMKTFLGALKTGDNMRVRGGIFEENGPMIRLNHPQNLEQL
ncbi:MAG: hypothetical protein SFW64_04025 [Alphaproteobacteria bacterium]|nr:hypothetical protein [Alphaproteobacteria bacterium]